MASTQILFVEMPCAVPLGGDLPIGMRTSSRGDQAYRQMAQLIRAGALRAGDVLPAERQLCRIYGIARGSLRGVLDLLVRDGVIRIQHGKPTQVTDLPVTCWIPADPAGAVSIAEQARELIATARQLCADIDGVALCRIDAERTSCLETLAEMQRDACDLPRFLIIDRRFYAELQACCDGPQLAPVWRVAGLLAHGALRDAFESERARLDAVACHFALTQAVARKAVAEVAEVLCGQLERRVAMCLAHEQDSEARVSTRWTAGGTLSRDA